MTALAEVQSLAAAACLFSADTPTDSLYLLAAGRLQCCCPDGSSYLVHPGQPVGVASVLAGWPRENSVFALRESLVLCFPSDALLPFLEQFPVALLALTRHFLQLQREPRVTTPADMTLALVPVSGQVPCDVLAEQLVERLGGWPKVRYVSARHVDAALGEGAANSRTGDVAQAVEAFLHRLASCHRTVLFVADSNDGPWALRCMRHGDRVLMLAEAGADRVDLPALRQYPQALRAPFELIILCAHDDPSPHTRDWREQLGARSHYYVQPWYGPDLDALARQITGRGIGLVLGGGGARGFAHIGLIKALEQLAIPVDVMGGTSMGAFVSALLACGLDSPAMVQVARDTFVNRNHLNDYTLPKVSLIRGRKFHQRLQTVFGARQIEALRRSYFCVSTNLSSGAAMVHEHGDVATWVGTSMCVPGVAPPVVYQGELLCDGGVVDNLPTDVLRDMERGVVIASSVSAQTGLDASRVPSLTPQPGALLKRWRGWRQPGFAEILLRTATLNSDTVIYPASVARSDLCLHMPVTDVNMFEWKALDKLVERGYRHALDELTPLRDQLINGKTVVNERTRQSVKS